LTSSGALKNHAAYTSAGVKVSDTDAAFALVFGFTGRIIDADTGLQNNLHRWYDAKVGRWISEDPIGFEAGDANLYRYVGNSPTWLTDSSGLNPGVGALAGLAGGAAGAGTAAAVAGGGAAIAGTAYGSYCFGSWLAQYTTVPIVNWWYDEYDEDEPQRERNDKATSLL
jgi:RHS repeat-associated protein